MKNFIKTIGFTFYSGDFYKKIKDESVGNAIVFLLKAVLFLSICVGIIGIIISIIFSPSIKKGISSFVNTNFPSDLVVTVKDGKMKTNTNQPFFVKDSSSPKSAYSKENAFVILPDEIVDTFLLSKYSTMAAMAKDGFVIEKNQGQEIRIIKYDTMSFVASRETVLKILNKIIPFFIVFFAIGIIPLMMFIFIFVITMHLIWLFFAALLIWGFLRLKKLNISYKQSYKIGMYIIIPLLVSEIIVFPFNFSGKLFTIAIMLIVTLVVTKNWEKGLTQDGASILEIKNV